MHYLSVQVVIIGAAIYLAWVIHSYASAIEKKLDQTNSLLAEILERQNDIIDRSKYEGTFGVPPSGWEHIGIPHTARHGADYVAPSSPTNPNIKYEESTRSSKGSAL